MTIKRLNYFQHQFLQVEEFQDEQTYHRDMRHRHNLCQHGSGIVEGLRVTGVSRTVTLERGLAIDKQGREIVIESDTPVTIPNRADATFYMVIAYRDDDQNGDYASTQPGMADKFTRTVETYDISWPSGAPGEGENNLILARLTTDADGNLEGDIDLNMRSEAAIRMGDGVPAGTLKFRLQARDRDAWPSIRAAERSPAADGLQDLSVDANKTRFSGDVEINGSLHVSTIENQTDLRIDDNIITVNDYPPRPTPRNTNGGLEVFRGGTAPNAQVIWNEALDRWQAGVAGSLDEIALADEVEARFHPASGHRHSGAAGDGPAISHGHLTNVEGVVPTSTNTVQDKHLSNAQARVWQTHVTQSGNPHSTTAAMIGALQASDYDFKNSASGAFTFTQSNASGATQLVTTGFSTRFIWLVGGVEATLGDRWFGSTVSGFADLGQSMLQRCNGVDITRLAVAPYWAMTTISTSGLCRVHFRDETVSPNRDNTLTVTVSARTSTGLTFQLGRTLPTTGFNQLTAFVLRFQFLCFG